jgi:hypothetical protein
LLSPPFSLIDIGVGDVGGSPSLSAPFSDVTGTFSIPNKYPFVAPPPGSVVDWSFYEPFTLNLIDPHFTQPYAMNYNLTVERELPARTVLSVGYVGSQARHLETTRELNPNLTPSACAAVPSCVANRSVMPLLNAFGIPGTSYAYPGEVFGSIAQQSTEGVSSYNSLQVSVKKAATHGLSFQAAYTYSHSIDTTSGFEDSLNRNFNQPLSFLRGDSAFDARQRLVLNWVYDLPAPHALTGNAFSRRVFDGWRVAGIATFQTGFPITIFDNRNPSLTCAASFSFYGCFDRPNVNGPVTIYPDPRTSPNNEWFDPSVFSHAAFGSVGNLGRNPFHGPGSNNFDLTVFKEIPIDESKRFELRAEMFNAFNHAQFLNPCDPTGIVFCDANSPGTFGRVLATAPARQVQLAAKFYF